MRGLDEKALQAKDKKAGLGQDIDLDAYLSEPVSHDYVEDISTLSEADKKRMILAGVDASETDRSGTYIQKDTTAIHAHS
ncbi:MAG: SufD family Fe-S cluster assembly protein, partial [Desulfobacteria bacterium]